MLCSGHLKFGLVQGFHKLRQNAYLDPVVALVCASCYHQVMMASVSTVSPVEGSCFGRRTDLEQFIYARHVGRWAVSSQPVSN